MQSFVIQILYGMYLSSNCKWKNVPFQNKIGAYYGTILTSPQTDNILNIIYLSRCLDWIHLAHNLTQHCALVNATVVFLDCIKVGTMTSEEKIWSMDLVLVSEQHTKKILPYQSRILSQMLRAACRRCVVMISRRVCLGLTELAVSATGYRTEHVNALYNLA
jgi:hypothetical protein